MLDLFIVLLIGIIIGWKANDILNRVILKSILEDLGVDEKKLREMAKKKGIDLPVEKEEEPELTVLEVKIEQHQGILFAFRKDNDQFLGQGTDREKLIESLTHNLTNVRVIISKEDGGDHLLQKNNT